MLSTADPSRFLPLTAPTFYVLLALAEDDRHGYAIIKDVSDATSGAVELGTGTLYGIIKRLLASELVIESQRRPKSDEDDLRRRYYRLTSLGRKVVEAEAARLERMVHAARNSRVLRKA